MFEAMSLAQVHQHTAELLPARTVLSMMGASTGSGAAPVGHSGSPDGGDHPMYDAWMNALTLLGVPHAQPPADSASH